MPEAFLVGEIQGSVFWRKSHVPTPTHGDFRAGFRLHGDRRAWQVETGELAKQPPAEMALHSGKKFYSALLS